MYIFFKVLMVVPCTRKIKLQVTSYNLHLVPPQVGEPRSTDRKRVREVRFVAQQVQQSQPVAERVREAHQTGGEGQHRRGDSQIPDSRQQSELGTRNSASSS